MLRVREICIKLLLIEPLTLSFFVRQGVQATDVRFLFFTSGGNGGKPPIRGRSGLIRDDIVKM